MSKLGASLSQILAAFALALSAAAAPPLSTAQQAKPEAKDAKPAPAETNPAQIELLETKYRFESNGDSRKEVHTRVRINNELGARQFARLNFDFNRSFQSVEIPFVRVTHASGGTADILPSAITDNPNAAVVDYPAYHDVRVKSVRILGLQPDDLLEYRVITTTTHHPLAPDFWLDHTFDRSGVVSQELFEVDVPELMELQQQFNPRFFPDSTDNRTEGRITYRWHHAPTKAQAAEKESAAQEPDIILSTFRSWEYLAQRLYPFFAPNTSGDPDIKTKALELAGMIKVSSPNASEERAEAFYEFVSKKIKIVDLPLGATGFHTRNPWEILKSGYATSEDKVALFVALADSFGLTQLGLLSMDESNMETSVARPSAFQHILTFAYWRGFRAALDLSVDVAPFKVIPVQFRGKKALMIGPLVSERWRQVEYALPYDSQETVSVNSHLNSDGQLIAKVRYGLRGDNELLLRVAFHKAEKDKWKDVAQMLALSDGFRGQVVNVTASDPYATKEPFTIEYDISQPKFVDWSKKTVRIPAILPLPGLPDAPTAEQIKSGKPIELGTPLAIDLEATIELPAGATAQAPIGTTVNRDYATFTSKYSVQGNTLHATRSLHFISSELPAARATDFNAFLHAVQSDQTQFFTITSAPPK